MSSVAAPPDTRLLPRLEAVSARRPRAELLFGLALAVALALVGLRGGGGLAEGPTTKTEIAFDLVAGLFAAAAALTAGLRRWWGGLTTAAFAVLAVVTAISIVWAVQPSDAWLEANRTVSYLAVFAAAVLAARIGGAWWTAVLSAVLAAAVAVCTWAILTKIFPGSLASDEIYARLREPYGYWNAVGLTAAMGVPAALWLGARRSGHAALNALAYPAMGVLVLTIMLSYSRGALLAMVLGCACWFAVVPLRLRGVAVFTAGALGALLVTAWDFSQDTLTKDNVTLAQRATSGHELGIAVLAMLLVLGAAGLAIGFAAARRAPQAATRRLVGAALLLGLALVPVALVVALALSSKGLGGSVSSGWKSLTDPHSTTVVLNDPSRLTSVGSVRARYWSEAYKIWRADPWKGVGAGGYGTARTRYRSDALAVRHAHGYVVQTAADLGILGLLASLALVLAWAVAAGRTLGWRVPGTHRVLALVRRGPPGGAAESVPGDTIVAAYGPERVAMATLAAIVVVFALHSFVDWTWFVPGDAVVAMVCAGWVAGRGPLTDPPADPLALPVHLRAGVRDPWRISAACLGLALALVAAWSAWEPLRSVDAGNAALEAAGPSPAARTKALRLADQAERRNPLSIDPLLVRAVIENIAGHPGAARRALVDAVRLQPSNPEAWEHLARFTLDRQHKPVQALRLLGPVLYLDPQSSTGKQDFLDALRAATSQAQHRAAERQARAAAKARARARKRAGG